MNRITSAYKLEIYAQLEEHIEGIQHFDVLQCILRKMSITLLIGTFSAIGFLLSLNPPILPFRSIAISIFICLFSFLMNTIILTIDLIFIENLLVATFIDVLRLEKENPWLFPIHSHMVNSSRESHGCLSKKLQFYIGYSKDLLFLLFLCVSFLLEMENWKWIVFLLLPITLLLISGYGKLLKTLAARSEARFHKLFKNELGESWMKI